MNHVNLALGDCPDFLFGAFTPPADRWAAVSKAAAAAAPLPSPPGSPAHASHGSPSAPQRDALCIEPVTRLVEERLWPDLARGLEIRAAILGDELPYRAGLCVAARE